MFSGWERSVLPGGARALLGFRGVHKLWISWGAASGLRTATRRNGQGEADGAERRDIHGLATILADLGDGMQRLPTLASLRSSVPPKLSGTRVGGTPRGSPRTHWQARCVWLGLRQG